MILHKSTILGNITDKRIIYFQTTHYQQIISNEVFPFLFFETVR